jgi:hypothetical protein
MKHLSLVTVIAPFGFFCVHTAANHGTAHLPELGPHSGTTTLHPDHYPNPIEEHNEHLDNAGAGAGVESVSG